MKLLFIFLLTTRAIFQCSPCQTCSFGLNIVNSSLAVDGNKVQNMLITADKIFFNGNSSWLRVFNSNGTRCIARYMEINSSSSLESYSKFVRILGSKWSTFNADYGLAISMQGIGNYFCDLNNIFNVVFLSNENASFIYCKYKYVNYENNNEFSFGLDSKTFMNTSHFDL